MKKIYALLLIMACTSMSFAQVVWDNFEDTRKGTYDFISGSFIPYNENPDQSGANTSTTAARYTRNAAELFDVIILDAQMADLSDYLSGAKQMSIDVWSPGVGTTVQITLESTATAEPGNFPVGRHSVYLTETSVAGAWETLTFSFDNQPDASVANDNVDRIVLLFDPNTNNADEYYFDNLRGPEFASDPCESVEPDASVLNDFECNQNVRYTFSHAGVNHRRVINPDQDGNTSEYVATYTRNGGEEFDVIIGKFDGNLPVNADTEVKLDVWDPNAPTEVIVSLQADNGDIILEMTAMTSVSNEWETLVYDASPVAGAPDIAQFVILFDPGNFSSLNYYYDNFKAESPTSVRDITAEIGLVAFPNPTTGIANFQYQLEQTSDVLMSVTDITGRTVERLQFNDQVAGQQLISLDASAYPNGIYIYTLLIDGNVATGKFVVSKQ